MKVLVFGGSGLVGSRFIELKKNQFEIKSPDAKEVDILDQAKVSQEIEQFNPDAVINFAAYTNVEEAEKDQGNIEGICYKINVVGAKNIVDACRAKGKYLIHISTEYVFDGTKSDSPYTEEDTPNPINWYGKTKYLAEQEIGEDNLIVRISMPYRSKYEVKKDVARFFLEQLKNGNSVKAITDQKITPTLVDDISHSLAVLVEKKPTGIYHVSSKSPTTPFEFAKVIAQTFNLDLSLISEISLDEYNQTKLAKLLKYSWLDCSKFVSEFPQILHSVRESMDLFKRAVDPDLIGVDEE